MSQIVEPLHVLGQNPPSLLSQGVPYWSALAPRAFGDGHMYMFESGIYLAD